MPISKRSQGPGPEAERRKRTIKQTTWAFGVSDSKAVTERKSHACPMRPCIYLTATQASQAAKRSTYRTS